MIQSYGNWFKKKEKFLIMYHRIALGHNIARTVYAYNLKDAYDLYAKEMERVGKLLFKK